MNTQQFIDLKQKQGPKTIKSVLKNRFSPRVFGPEPVQEEDIHAMMEAAQWAASHYNTQTWYFSILKKGTATFDNAVATMADYNQGWAKNAPILIVASYITVDEDKYNQNPYAQYNLGLAAQSIVVEAMTRGYHVRQMGGFDNAKMAEVVKVDSHTHPLVVVAVGKIGDYSKVDDELLGRETAPRERKDSFYEILS